MRFKGGGDGVCVLGGAAYHEWHMRTLILKHCTFGIHYYIQTPLPYRGTFCGKVRLLKNIIESMIFAHIRIDTQVPQRLEEFICLEPLRLRLSWSTMPHFFSNIPDNLRVILSQAANIFLVIVLIYIIQYIFNAEFSCTCTPVIHKIVFIYICLIPIILFFILKIVKHTRTKVCGGCCCGIWSQISQLLGICLYWWGFILLDGDLYLCMATKFNDSLVEIPCKKERTLHENSVITIYKNTSQVSNYNKCVVFCQFV